MERASKLIRGMKLPGGTISVEEVACSVWAGAVGNKIAPHARAMTASASVGGASYDEADGIADPVLRSIYRASRKKALA